MDVFYAFLETYRADRGEDFTHTSLGYPKGAYYIPREQAETFFQVYANAVSIPGMEVYLTERHKDIGPVVIDMDFKFTGGEPKRLFTADHLKTIVKTYVASMLMLLKVRSPVSVAVMVKEHPVMYNGGIKDGVHIVFPDVVTPATEQFMIRSDVLKKLPSALDLTPTNPWSDIIDDQVIMRNNWMMYGSCKPNCERYEMLHAWDIHFSDKDCDGMHVPDPEMFEIRDSDARLDDLPYWVRRLSIRNKTHMTETLQHRRRDVFLLDEHMSKAVKPPVRAEAPSCPQQRDELDIVRRLVSILAPERAEGYISWMKVGWCLYNIDSRLLETWIRFSQMSAKYKSGECERIWNSKMRRDTLGIGSLMMWAKEDNPLEFRAIIKTSLRSLIFKCCNANTVTHHDVAKVVHAMYRHMYACASIKYKLWYEFKEHRWHVCDSAYTLRKALSTEVYAEFLAAAAYFQNMASAEAEQSPEDNDSEKRTEQVKRLINVANKLRNVSFKESLLKELSEMFYHPGFEEKLNSAEHLIGFDNGVFDLDAGVFRDGDPDDFISFSTGYDYIPYDVRHPIVGEIEAFFSQLFRQPPIRTYVQQTLASCLHGGIKYERYMIWYGELGANGKSKLLELIESTFGDYSVKFPISMLTQKRVASNAATSELARSKGRRFASMQEPGENEVLNIGLMKELSGNDRIVARHLFHEPIEFRPFYKMFMCCNQLPAVHSQDGGTWRRIRVVNFLSKFCENPDPDNCNEFLVDYDLSSKFPAWRPYMMGRLLDMFPQVKGGIKEPTEIVDSTLKYRKENDSVAEFYESCVRLCDDPESVVTSTSMWKDYVSWKKREGVNRHVKRAEFKAMIEKFMGPFTNADHTGWSGHVSIVQGDD